MHTKPNSKNKSKSTTEGSIIRILSMGNVDLTYTLSLSQEDITKYKIDFEHLSKIKDLSFLYNAKALWVKIFLTTTNPTLSTLLYLNRSTVNKTYIEYLCYKLPSYGENEQSLSEMLNAVNELNYLFLNKKTQLFSVKGTCKLTLNLLYNGATKTFELGQDPKEKKTMKIKVKKSEAPSFLDKIHLECKSYDYYLSNITDAFQFNIIEDYIEFLTFLKTKHNANIIIHYTDVTEKISSHDDMININTIYLLTDTFIIDTKSAYVNFNQHYKTFNTKSKNNTDIEANKVNSYFINSICCGGQLSLINSKVAILYEENLSKITLIEVPSTGKSLILNYDIKPFPKINHTNVDLIEEYKRILKENADYYTHIFIGGFLSRFVNGAGKNKGIDTLYSSYLAGVSLIKRILTFKVKDCELPSTLNFYIVRLNQGDIAKYVRQYYLDRKEGKFVLDCTNPTKARMKSYVPLFDNNLHEFFGKDIIKKELKKKGFINSKGFVNYDPLYREEMIPKLRRRKSPKPLNGIEQQNLIIKRTIQENEKSSSMRVLTNFSPTIKKLPTDPCEAYLQRHKKMVPRLKGIKGEYQKCNYCVLKDKSRELDKIEDEKRKIWDLRK